jgi:hypothetical protein
MWLATNASTDKSSAPDDLYSICEDYALTIVPRKPFLFKTHFTFKLQDYSDLQPKKEIPV